MVSSTACRVLFFLSLSLGGALSARHLSEAKESPVNLLAAGDYVILTKTGISSVPNSAVTGDIAVSPIDATAITGFSMSKDLGGEFSTSSQVSGQAFAANYAAPIPSTLTTAVSNMEAAYTDAAGRLSPDTSRHNLNGGTLGGDFGGFNEQLTPGVYTFGSSVSIATDIFFHGSGSGAGQGETDVFIIQMTGDLLMAANVKVTLTNGALAKNIFWQVAGNVQIGEGAHMEGVLLVKTDVVFKTKASLNGRVLAQTACDLQMATITAPAN